MVFCFPVYSSFVRRYDHSSRVTAAFGELSGVVLTVKVAGAQVRRADDASDVDGIGAKGQIQGRSTSFVWQNLTDKLMVAPTIIKNSSKN